MPDGHPTSTALPFRCPGRQREPRAALCGSEQGAAFTNPCKADWGPQSPGDSMADLGEEGDSTCTLPPEQLRITRSLQCMHGV